MSRADAEQLLRPRVDILRETTTSGDGPTSTHAVFAQATGPFSSYRREASFTPDDSGLVTYEETTTFRTAIPVWGRGVDLLMRTAVRDLNRTPRHRWWWPDEVVTTHTTTIISLLSLLGMIGAYTGVNIGQTITFATAEFGSSDTAQANALAATRVGVIITTLLIWRADRIGRKPLLIAFAAGSTVFTIAGAFSTSLLFLTLTQAVARGFATGLLTLVTLAATEEIPRTMRAFILSILTLCGALGAGAVLWFLPLADLDERGWRLVYLIPVLFLPVIVWIWRIMPETRRFTAADLVRSPGFSSVNLRWFALIVFIYSAVSVFGAPAGQLQNEYLRDDLGFSAGDISLFRVLITTPAGLVILLAGWVADRRGRRMIAAVSLAVGSVMAALFFRVEGTALWVTAGIAAWLGGAAFPVIRAYQTELFPTRSRALVGGWLDLFAVAGSAIGLVIAGQLIEGERTISEALLYLLPLPLLVAVIIPILLPPTAGVELEDLNPTDPELASALHPEGASTSRSS
ncbi:MAG: MFS transporter [Acidimicrobiia bacterium]|nr:MFS transporter [Acidimicrobiia bacterium]